MHIEILKRSKKLLIWLSRMRDKYDTSFTADHLNIIWNSILTSSPDLSTECLSLLVSSLIYLPETMVAQFLYKLYLILHDGKPEETGKIKTEGEKQKYDEANEEKPFIARLIVELGKADLKIISTDHSVKVTLSIIWKLMWWDRDTNVKDEDDAIIRNDLLSIFGNIIILPTAFEYRSYYVQHCLQILIASTKSNNLKTYTSIDRQLSFRLLRTIVDTMDFNETESLIKLHEASSNNNDDSDSDDSKNGNTFINMLIHEYCDFTTIRAAATNTSSSNTNVMDEMTTGVDERLKFLYLILKKSSLKLLSSHAIELHRALPVYCKDILWDWLSSLCDDSNCIENNSIQYIFSNLLCSSLTTSTISIKCWTCWKMYFLNVNDSFILSLNGGDICNIYHVTTEHLIGIDILWNIATTSLQSTVTYHSKELFKTIINNLQPKGISKLIENRRQNVMAKVELILQYKGNENENKNENSTTTTSNISDTNDSSNDTNEETKESNEYTPPSNEGELNEQLNNVGKSLELLGECMKSCPQSSLGDSSIKPHGAAGQGTLIRLRIHLIRTTTDMMPKTLLDSNYYNDIKNKNLNQILLHSKMTLKQMKTLIKRHINRGYQSTNNDKLKFISSVELYRSENWARTDCMMNDALTLNELGIVDGMNIHVSAACGYISHNQMNNTEITRKFIGATPWDELVSDPKYDLLFDLFDYIPTTASSIYSSNVREIVWSFLQSMPTQSTLLTVLSSPYTLAKVPFNNWFKHSNDYSLNQSKYAKAVYVLQILDAMLMPSDVALEDEHHGISLYSSNHHINNTNSEEDEEFRLSKQKSETAALWRKLFLQCSGFDSVLNFLLSHDCSSSSNSSNNASSSKSDETIKRTGLSLALRLSKFFLVGMLNQRGIEVNDDRKTPLPPINAKNKNNYISDSEFYHISNNINDEIDDCSKNEIKMGSSTNGEQKASSHTANNNFNNNSSTDDSQPVSPATSVSSNKSLDLNYSRPPILRSFSVDSAEEVHHSLEGDLLINKLMEIVFHEQKKNTTTFPTNNGNGGANVGDGERTEMLVTSLSLVDGLLRLKPEHVDSILIERNEMSLSDVLLREKSLRVRNTLSNLFLYIVESTFDVDNGKYLKMISNMIMKTISSISLNNVLITCDEFFQFVRNTVLHNLSTSHDDILPITTTIVQLLVNGVNTTNIIYDGKFQIYILSIFFSLIGLLICLLKFFFYKKILRYKNTRYK